MLVLSPDAPLDELKAVDIVGHQLGFACPGTPKARGVAVGVTIGILLSNARLMSATGGAKAALLPRANRAAANRVILAARRRGYRVIEPAFFVTIATYVRSWHIADVPPFPPDVRYRGQTGHSADSAEGPRLTRSAHSFRTLLTAETEAACGGRRLPDFSSGVGA
jgi:hypothetical protein